MATWSLFPPQRLWLMGENGQPHFCEQGMCYYQFLLTIKSYNTHILG